MGFLAAGADASDLISTSSGASFADPPGFALASTPRRPSAPRSTFSWFRLGRHGQSAAPTPLSPYCSHRMTSRALLVCDVNGSILTFQLEARLVSRSRFTHHYPVCPSLRVTYHLRLRVFRASEQVLVTVTGFRSLHPSSDESSAHWQARDLRAASEHLHDLRHGNASLGSTVLRCFTSTNDAVQVSVTRVPSD